MNNRNKQTFRPDKLSILSACGSVASLAALVIVLIEGSSEDPQMVVWRMTFSLLCLLVIGEIIVFELDYLRTVSSNHQTSIRSKTIKTVASLIPTFVFLAVFVDGLLASIQWR